MEHGDRRYQSPSWESGKGSKPKGTAAVQDPNPQGLLETQPINKKKPQRNVRIILAAVIEKNPSYSASTCENFSFAQINFKPSILVC